MPNRILKESICMSNNLNNLTPEEEIFFYRLIVNCDDYGRMDARPGILRARLFPLRTDIIKEDHIIKWFQSLKEQDLVDIYEVNGQQYLQIKTWENHQQIRAKRSKYPDPDGNLITLDGIGNQMKSSVIKCPRNPIQSESNPNPIFSSESLEMKLSLYFKEYILKNNPKAKIPQSLNGWCGHFNKMIQIDKRTEDEVKSVIGFSQADSFWKSNILSPQKLRDKFDALWLKSQEKAYGTHRQSSSRLIDRDKYTPPANFRG